MHFHVDHVIMLHSISLIPGSKLTSSANPGLIWENCMRFVGILHVVTSARNCLFNMIHLGKGNPTTTAATTTTTTTTTKTTRTTTAAAATTTTHLTTPSSEARDKHPFKVFSFTVAAPLVLKDPSRTWTPATQTLTGSWWKADVQDTWGEKHHWSQSDLVDLVRQKPKLRFSRRMYWTFPGLPENLCRLKGSSLSMMNFMSDDRNAVVGLYTVYIFGTFVRGGMNYSNFGSSGWVWGSNKQHILSGLGLFGSAGWSSSDGKIGWCPCENHVLLPIKRVPIAAEAPLMWQKHDLKNVACNFFVMENRVVEKPKGIQMKVRHTVTLRTDKGTELLVDNVRGLYLGLRVCYQRP